MNLQFKKQHQEVSKYEADNKKLAAEVATIDSQLQREFKSQ